MPAEAVRLQRRLGTRDRWFLALLGFAVITGTLAALVLGQVGSSSTEANAGCISVTRASWMGAATFKACGADAAAFCRTSARGDEEIAAKCAEEGYATNAT